MRLIDLQRDMRAWLMREDASAAIRIGENAAPGLRVYQNNFRSQLAACIEDGFARTRDWIGGEAFHQAVIAHVERVPPSSWTLDAYSRDFPATLAMLYADDPEIPELAWIELALAEAFVGPDATALTAFDLGEVDWDRATLRLAPTLDFGELTTNAPAIWSALAEGEAPPAVAYLPEPGAILVWREGDAPRFRAIDQLEHHALLRVRGGMPFAGLCATMVETFGEEAGITRAGQLLGQWLADGLVVALFTEEQAR
ncbi:HvfC/BufC N-terminal domain-containing protein [Sphingomonas sp. UNC305MFCol5.2]|uniref:HvfC/BufC N-terminal domain-containing protein n=1 Tax=Sphingomonas sp. UNC305MFCol5.2 TaxID=1449076 RepID=UPI0004A6E2A7|nr:DNA-binding domain-containing protein [Sphingomonas sp. UNC305MFCol5.2]